MLRSVLKLDNQEKNLGIDQNNGYGAISHILLVGKPLFLSPLPLPSLYGPFWKMFLEMQKTNSKIDIAITFVLNSLEFSEKK